MNQIRTIQRNLAAYGVGRGNAPASLLRKNAGHLKAAFLFNFLNFTYYEQLQY